MLDANGRLIRSGDQVSVEGGVDVGVVVYCIDMREGSLEHPAGSWDYLDVGVMVETPLAGLIHYTSPFDIEVISPEASEQR
jgi:hypothetical protein